MNVQLIAINLTQINIFILFQGVAIHQTVAKHAILKLNLKAFTKQSTTQNKIQKTHTIN